MSEMSQGQGWWIASDGNWYPPELHPSVREQKPAPVPTKMHVPTQPVVPSAEAGPPAWQVEADHDTPVGPQFPDLFQKALQGSHLADTVTVASSADDGLSPSFTSPPAGTPSGKRRWRKGS